MFQLAEACPRALHCSFGLLILGKEFLIFQANQNLALFYFVAFFHANPGNTASDFGIHVNLVVSDDITAGREHNPTDVAILGGSASYLNFRDIGRE